MKHAVEMGSGTVLYIPSFIKIGSSIQELIGVIHRHTEWRSYKPTFGEYAKNRILRIVTERLWFEQEI
jgi:hypothetical protein